LTLGPQIDPFESDERQPARTGVVVIGGGIIGISTALALARAGVAVTLCEKGELVGEQSSRNWGWVRKTGRDQREIPLIIEALRMWGDMNRTVEAETGFHRCGVLYAGETDAERASHQAWLEKAQPYQMGSRLVEGAELAALLPGATRRYKSGLYTPDDGRAEPQKAGPAIARAARRAGAVILTHCAVRGLDMAAGRVAGVVTERGRIACDAVVLAGGAWSRLFCGSLGLRLPQLKVRSSVLRTAPIANAPEVSAWTGEFAYRKRMDGGYTIANGRANVVPIVPDTLRFLREYVPAIRASYGHLRPRLDERFMAEARTPKTWALDAKSPFEDTRMLDPTPTPSINRAAVTALQAVFPAFRDIKIVQEWAGLIDVTPDAVPVISSIDAVPGLIVATGFSGHGFGIGPAAGRLAADLATGAPPIVDPHAFRFSRFSDGSPIVVEAPA
jgi:glycine/D-amino acid oxidase-like deaminating enzyme